MFTIEELINIGIPFSNCRITNLSLEDLTRFEYEEEHTVYGSINEFEVIRYPGLVCAMMVGPIVHETYNFGTRGRVVMIH